MLISEPHKQLRYEHFSDFSSVQTSFGCFSVSHTISPAPNIITARAMKYIYPGFSRSIRHESRVPINGATA